jgi:hypothetical protein
MSSSAGGPLGALLMIAPLAAIPVLAVVGVPQFAPVVASSSDDEDSDEAEWQLEESAARPRPKRGSASDLFAPIEERGAARAPASRQSAAPDRSRWMGGQTGAAERPRSRSASENGFTVDEVDALEARNAKARRGAAASSFGKGRATLDEEHVEADEFTPGLLHPVKSRAAEARGTLAGQGGSEPAERGNPSFARGTSLDAEQQSAENSVAAAGFRKAAEEQSGWAAAAARLKLLGIRRHQLDPRLEVNNRVRFVFTCYLAEEKGSRVVQHFSHVADTPLEAIEATLDAVERWRAEAEQPGPANDEAGFLEEDPSGRL